MQQNQTTRGNKKPFIKGNMITAIMNDGSSKDIDIRSIKGWKKRSGTASCGTEVHSLHTYQIGKTTVLASKSDDKSEITANDINGIYLTPELEVASNQLFGGSAGNSKGSKA